MQMQKLEILKFPRNSKKLKRNPKRFYEIATYPHIHKRTVELKGKKILFRRAAPGYAGHWKIRCPFMSVTKKYAQIIYRMGYNVLLDSEFYVL